jgi:FkbM family methyltransferase
MVGAHDGSRTSSFIDQCAARGKVLLVEPVPYLFERLKNRFSGTANITCLNEVISEVDGYVDFYMPLADSNEITTYGDQIGSLNANHAELHDPKFKDKIVKVKSKSRTLCSLLADFDIQRIDVLWTDMEGHDATCLISFPFHLVKPGQIFFEAKHSDGVMRIGRNFATLLLLLDELKYAVTIHDKENCLATYSP